MGHFKRLVLLNYCALTLGCGAKSVCDSGSCATGGVVINELAGTGGDYVELFNASDAVVDLSGYGLADSADGGIRYASAVRVPAGTSLAARGYFTFSLETDCTVSPCVRGEFGISQSAGELITLLDDENNLVEQQTYPANAAAKGSSWARTFDGASAFEVQRRSPGAANAP